MEGMQSVRGRYMEVDFTSIQVSGDIAPASEPAFYGVLSLLTAWDQISWQDVHGVSCS